MVVKLGNKMSVVFVFPTRIVGIIYSIQRGVVSRKDRRAVEGRRVGRA